jgi:hypothetical protein
MDSCISALATAVGTELKGKQDVLVSGTDIKTVNGTSLLGSGDLVIAGGGGTTYTAGNAIDLTGDVVAVTAACDTKWSTDTVGSNAICVITENTKTGYGTCYRAANPGNYGDIGCNAIDLSYSPSVSTTTGATGCTSIAMGYSTCATGCYSMAMGQSTIAEGRRSTAMGHSTYAAGHSSTAIGYYACAIGSNSLAVGYNTCAAGDTSIAMGYNTRAAGNYSTTIGCNTRAYTASSLVLGQCTQIGSSSSKIFAVGYGSNAHGTTTDDYNIKFSVDCLGSVCIVDGTQGVGKVLTSDAAGKACWATPSGGGTTYTAGNGIDLTGDVIAIISECDTKWAADTIYTHPVSHPASIITQDSNNRFVTDIEKSSWDGKQTTLVSGTNIKTINGNSLLGSGDIVISVPEQNVFIQEATPTIDVGASALWICKGTDGTITFNLVEG